jgi:glycosyltransferase involved in cell wall biosynthesis
MHYFNEVALLITVYNRSSSLERLLVSLKALDIHFGEIVVSDDFSNEFHLSKMKSFQELFGFKLIQAEINKGLANNINKGQNAISKEFVIYIQEDFVPEEIFADTLAQSLAILKKDDGIDTIRFYSYFPYPNTKPYNSQFDEMVFEHNFLKWNHLKFYMYSDHPHIKRRSFVDKFGKYKEGIQSDEAEFEMCLSYIKNSGRGLLVKEFSKVFDQKNNIDEPSTIGRKLWRQKQTSSVQILRRIFLIFRYIKNNIQLSLKK